MPQDGCHAVPRSLGLEGLQGGVQYRLDQRERETDEEVIFPIYLYTTALPTYMKYRNYFDCREGDNSKIAEASTSLLAALAKT